MAVSGFIWVFCFLLFLAFYHEVINVVKGERVEQVHIVHLEKKKNMVHVIFAKASIIVRDCFMFTVFQIDNVSLSCEQHAVSPARPL